jgi:hypothetical protein
MNTLTPKMQMLAVLGATRALVAQSPRLGWEDVAPAECVAILDQMMAHLSKPAENAVPKYASILFAPTGPIQDIAISDGWHEAYMSLSEEYDRLDRELNLFSTPPSKPT